MAAAWIAAAVSRSYSPQTVHRHICTLRTAVEAVGPLQDADDEAWRAWFEARALTIGSESLAGELSVIRSALAWSGLTAPRLVPPRRPARLPRPYPLPDVQQALVGCPEPERSMIVLMVAAGLRCMECAELQVEDLDLHARRVTVLGKGSRERTVPLGAAAAAALRHGRWPRSGYAFRRSDTGGPYSAALVSHHVGRAMRGGGLEGGAHRLRHTYATELLEAGMPLEQVMRRLGHTGPAMTMRYVRLTVRVDEADDLAAAAILGRTGRRIAAV